MSSHLLSCGVLCCCLLATPSFSQSDQPSSPDLNQPADHDGDGDHGHDHGPEHGAEHDHDDEIVVTITGRERQQFDVIRGSSVIAGDELVRSQSATLGETVASQPGTRSTGFAPGSGRPVIRGLGGPRVRTLQNGVGNIDASVTSPDHYVATEPLLAERIEVLRGAGTLRYGSNAVGGVVNVVDGVIPESIPDGGVKGVIQSNYGTNQDERNLSGAVRLGTGQFAVQAQGFGRRGHDLNVPGRPLSSDAQRLAPDDPFAGVSGRVPSSAIDKAQGGDIGASWIFDRGFLGVGYSRLESRYGLPVAEEEEEGEEEEEEEEGGDILLDSKQNRFHLAGELREIPGPFRTASLRAVYGDYEHAELEGDETGTVFDNRGFEGRLEFEQRTMGALEGNVGLQVRWRDFEAVGAEAFVPPTETTQWAVFAVEELHLHPFRLEGGLRYEFTDQDASSGLSDRQFHSFSGSVGAAWEIDESNLLGLTLSATERPPIAEELYSDGPHLATGSFEIGDEDLDEEVAYSVELAAKHRGDRLRAGVNLFYTRYEDFIFEAATGEIEDGLPVFRFSQTDADFFGAEVEVRYTLLRRDDVEVHLDAVADWVRGRQTNDDNLPRIPPLRVLMGAEAESRFVDGRIEVEWVDDQNRNASFERSTDGYTMLHASVTVRPIPQLPQLSLLVQGRNLTNTRARNHVSFLKERVPLAGRDVRFGVRYTF